MRANSRCLSVVASVATVSLLVPEAPRAQSVTGSVRGQVVDQSGAAVRGVSLDLRSTTTAASLRAVTDEHGRYLFAFLPPGLCSIEASVAGFEPIQLSDLRVETGGAVTADIVLRPAGVVTRVDVRAKPGGGPLGAALATNIASGLLLRLPNLDRHVLQFAHLAPGVDAFLGAGQIIGQDGTNTLLANGQRSTQNGFYLDGAENAGAWRNWALQFPNPETVQEIQVQRANASAGLGGQPGAIVNVITRSGTDALHGTGFASFHDKRLNANSWENNRNGLAKPEDDQRKVGAVLGGPIRRGASFFFGSFNRFRTSQPVTQRGGHFPTAPMKRGDFSEVPDLVRPDGTRIPFDMKNPVTGESLGKTLPASLIDPVVLRLLELLPTADAYYDTAVRRFDRPWGVDEYLAKVDHRLTMSQSLSGTVMATTGSRIDPAQGFTNNQVPEWGAAKSGSRQLTASVRHLWSVTSALSLDSHVALAGNTSDVRPAGPMTGQQAFGIAFPFQPEIAQPPSLVLDFEGGFRADHQNNDFIGQGNHRVGVTASWLEGAHVLTFGGESEVDRVSFELNRDLRTSYRFSGRDALNGPIVSATQVPLRANDYGVQNFAYAFADLLLGRPVTVSTAGYSTTSFSSRTSHAFIQDEWRVSPRVSVWLGLRYEFASAASEAEGRFGGAFVLNHQSNQYPNAPRGLAWAGDANVPKGFIDAGLGTLSPRAGVAWRVSADGRTSLRSAAGLYHAGVPLGGRMFSGTSGFGGATPRAANTALSDPYGASRVNPYDTVLQYGPGNPLPDAIRGYTPATFPWASQFQRQIVRGVPTQIFVGPIVGYESTVTAPSVAEYHVTLERELTQGWRLEAAYVGNRGRHQPLWQAFNAPVPEAGANTSDQSIRDRRPYAEYGGGRLFSTTLNTSYDAAQIASSVRLGGLTAQISYVAARSVSPFGINAQDVDKRTVEGFSTGAASGEAILTSASDAGQSSYPYDPGRDLAENGRRHTFKAHYVYELPWRQSGGWRGVWLDGWAVSGAFVAMSGLPLNILWGLDANADGSPYDRPNLVSSIQYPRTAVPDASFDRRGAIQFIDPASFVGPCHNNERTGSAAFCPTPGNLPRNAATGVSVFNVDLAVLKRVHVGGSKNVDVRLEAVNVTNTNFLGAPELNLSSPFFGQVSGRIHRPRQMQVGIRFEF